MVEDIEITVWMNKYRLDALHDQGVNVEVLLTEYLADLYARFVPAEIRGQIDARIDNERDESERLAEQNRRYALLEIVENGVSCYCESEKCTTLFAVASRFIQALKAQKAQGNHLQGGLTDLAFGDCYDIAPEIIQDHTGPSGGAPRVVLCAMVNFDEGHIDEWDADSRGWTRHDSGRLAGGIRAAERKKQLAPKFRERAFDAKIHEGTPELDEDEECGMGLRL